MKGDQIKYRAGYKYQLVEDYTITLPDDDIWYFGEYDNGFIKLTGDQLTIRCGYAWDGPSGPTYDTHTSMRGSLVHDARYQLIQLGVLERKTKAGADQQLRDICVEDGMWPLRAAIWQAAVERFGSRHTYNERPILLAPKLS